MLYFIKLNLTNVKPQHWTIYRALTWSRIYFICNNCHSYTRDQNFLNKLVLFVDYNWLNVLISDNVNSILQSEEKYIEILLDTVAHMAPSLLGPQGVRKLKTGNFLVF